MKGKVNNINKIMIRCEVYEIIHIFFQNNDNYLQIH